MIYPFDFSWDSLRLYTFTITFVIVGVTHFTKTDFYVKLVTFLPFPKFIVYSTGIIELLLGGFLLFDRFRLITSWITVFYLVVIFPANVYMAVKPELFPNISNKAAWFRLPFQILFVVWAISLARIRLVLL